MRRLQWLSFSDADCGSSPLMLLHIPCLQLPEIIMTPKIEYGRIPKDEIDESQAIPSGNRTMGSRWARRTLIACLICVFSLAAVILARTFIARSTSDSAGRYDWTPCGDSPDEARLNRCHFDPMLNSWVLEACYIAELGEEYDMSEFLYFVDKNKTQPVDVEEIRHGVYDHHVWTDGSHHDQHCIYTWRKLSLAIETRLPLIDTKTADFHHSTHCAQTVREVVSDALHTVDRYHGRSSFVPLAVQGCVRLF